LLASSLIHGTDRSQVDEDHQWHRCLVKADGSRRLDHALRPGRRDDLVDLKIGDPLID
jgi:hypothetical protein